MTQRRNATTSIISITLLCLLLILLVSCKTIPPSKKGKFDCPGFNSKLWKKDRFGCNNYRPHLLDTLNYFCNLRGHSKKEIEQVLGKPDVYFNQTFNDKKFQNKTFGIAVYYLQPCHKCRVIWIRRKKIKFIDEFTFRVIYDSDTVRSFSPSAP